MESHFRNKVGSLSKMEFTSQPTPEEIIAEMERFSSECDNETGYVFEGMARITNHMRHWLSTR